MRKQQNMTIILHKGKVYKTTVNYGLQKEECIKENLACELCKNKDQCEIFDIRNQFHCD